MRICRKCKISKPETEYRKTFIKTTGKYYFRSYCKPCLNKILYERRHTIPRLHEKEKARLRKQYYKNKVTSPSLRETK